MIRLPTDISANDIQQWLEGGVFFAQPTPGSEFKLGTLYNVASPTSVNVCWTATGTRSEVPVSNVRAHWPRCGAINLPAGYAVDVQRLQRKQFRRTYNSRCARTSVPGKWHLLRRYEGNDLNPDVHAADYLRALFYPEYPIDAASALRRLSPDVLSVAVNPSIVLVSNKVPRVYYRGDYVGRYDGAMYYSEAEETLAAHVRKLLGG